MVDAVLWKKRRTRAGFSDQEPFSPLLPGIPELWVLLWLFLFLCPLSEWSPEWDALSRTRQVTGDNGMDTLNGAHRMDNKRAAGEIWTGLFFLS